MITRPAADGPFEVADAHRRAGAIVGQLEGVLLAATDLIADAGLDAGSLSPARLDVFQVECFELAWAAAELRAARAALGAEDALDRELALVFVAEIAVAAIQRFDSIAIALGAEIPALDAIRDECGAFRRDAMTSRDEVAIGEAVVERGGAVGHVELDEVTEMATEAFARFARDVVLPQAEHIHRHDAMVPETILGPMRELGAFGLAIPEAYGGSAIDERTAGVTMVAVTEILSEASLAAAGSLITRPEILSRALLAGGTEAQKQRFLPRIAAGAPLCAIAITEPDYGSDVASLALRATKVEGGWRLDGAKTWCTFAGKAELLMVVARTDPDRASGHRGLSLMMVEKPCDEGHAFAHDQDGGGRLTGRAIATIGYRGMHSFDLSFADWFVPDDHVVGEEGGIGRGFYLTMAGMTGGRMQTAARASGVMRAALRHAITYAQDRKVFGAPLASYPLTLAKIARMAARMAACRRLAFEVASAPADGDQSLNASLAKLVACRFAELVTREALQIHGGMGYAEESTVSRLFVDARVLSIFEGAEETLALKVIARGLVERRLQARAGR